MKLDFSINTENQRDVEDALNVLRSLSNTEPSNQPYAGYEPLREYICKTTVGIANIVEDEEGIYRILAGSVVAKDTSPSCSAKTKKLREQLISNGTIEIVDGKGIVRRDIDDLLSKSLVASVVTGTNTNGNTRLIEKRSQAKELANYRYPSISVDEAEDIKNLYRRVYDFVDFTFRNDIPEEMLKIYDFVQEREGLEIIVYDLQVTLFNYGLELPENDYRTRNRRVDLSLFDSLTIAYSWFSDFIRFLDSDETPPHVLEKSEWYRNILDALKKCIVLCCKESV